MYRKTSLRFAGGGGWFSLGEARSFQCGGKAEGGEGITGSGQCGRADAGAVANGRGGDGIATAVAPVGIAAWDSRKATSADSVAVS